MRRGAQQQLRRGLRCPREQLPSQKQQERGRRRHGKKQKAIERRRRKKWGHRLSSITISIFRLPFASIAFLAVPKKKKPKKQANQAKTMQAAAEKITRIFKKKDHEHEHDNDAASDHSEHSAHAEGEAEEAPAVER